MDASSLQRIADKTSAIAREAAVLLRQGFSEISGGHVAMNTKSTETDMVTEYDTRAEKMILDHLHRDFPDHGIVAEESGRSDQPGSPYRWFVDPIDGTNNFAHAIPHFCISIALYENDDPLVGVIYDPMRDELFSATAGGPATMTGADGQTLPLHVTAADALIRSIVVTGFAYDKHINPDNNLAEFAAMTKRVRGIRRFGSAALDCAWVAAGRFDAFWEKILNPWDAAAGALIVERAGGVVTQLNNHPIDINQHQMGLIFSNGLIHREVIEVLESVRPSQG